MHALICQDCCMERAINANNIIIILAGHSRLDNRESWKKNSLKYHLYADDTQLYISFTPTNSALCLETLTTTFTDILSWMNLNKLLLNPSKTEFLLIGTKQQRLKFSDLTNLSLSNDIIPVSSSARNLGFIFDSDMSFSEQINSLPKSCHFHIRD